MREVQLGIPLQPFAADDVSGDHELNTFVLDVTCVDHLSIVAAGRVHAEADELVGSVGAIPSEVYTKAAIEEAHFQTQLIGLDELTADLVVVEDVVDVGHRTAEGVLLDAVSAVELVRLEVITHLSSRGTYLSEGEP